MGAQEANRRKNYAADGKYIPLGGGSRGWVDNAGVAENERMNHYRYHQAARAHGFEHTLTNEGPRIERRNVKRKGVDLRVRYGSPGEEPDQPGFCRDLTPAGARVRVREELRPGASLTVVLLARRARLADDHPLLTLTARVIWCLPVDLRARSVRYDAGVEFDALTAAQQTTLERILGGRLDELLPGPEAEPSGNTDLAL